ncbi:MAG: hypothetical protein ACLQF1_09225 [Methyloceanibacter sp.]|jgi:hypothetical protein
MRKYIVVATLIIGFATPALAEQFYVAFDPASHKCTMMHSQPTGSMKSMGGPYKTEAEAKKAMAGMKDCAG